MEGKFDTIKLIDLVRETPEIYNKTHHNYFNNKTRQEKWSTIAAQLNISESQCKSKWKSLRERYVRKLKEEKFSGNQFSDGSQWPLFEEMEFLRDSVIPRRKISNSSSVSSENGASSPEIDPLSTTSQKNHKKEKLDDIVQQFGVVMEKIEKHLETKAAASTDSAFFDALQVLMADLPEKSKDMFKTEMLQRLIELKKQQNNASS